MSNLSFVPDEIFGDLDPTEISQTSRISSIIEEIYFSVATVLNIFICLCSAGASVFLIYIILKFERIKKKVSAFLLHYAVACCIDMLLVPLLTLIMELSYSHDWEIICTFYTMGDSACILVFVFATALGVYWFIENFKRGWIERWPRFQIVFIIICYILSIIKILYNIAECFTRISLQTPHVLVTFYFVLLMTIVFVNIATRKLKSRDNFFEKTKYELDVSTYVVLSYLPFLLCHYGLLYLAHRQIKVLIFVYYLTELYAFSGPIVVLYLLGKKNKYFKAAYSSVFKRSVKDYNEDDMNDESENFQDTPNNFKEATNDTAYAIVI